MNPPPGRLWPRRKNQTATNAVSGSITREVISSISERPASAPAPGVPTVAAVRKRGSSAATSTAARPSTVISPSVSKARKSTRITLTALVPKAPGTAFSRNHGASESGRGRDSTA